MSEITTVESMTPKKQLSKKHKKHQAMLSLHKQRAKGNLFPTMAHACGVSQMLTPKKLSHKRA